MPYSCIAFLTTGNSTFTEWAPEGGNEALRRRLLRIRDVSDLPSLSYSRAAIFTFPLNIL
jgi:hypothetical protein